MDLTPREFDLLSYLASRAGSVVSRRELLTQVWRQPYGGPHDTVDVHLSWLRRKLGRAPSSRVTCTPFAAWACRLRRRPTSVRSRTSMRVRLILLVGATSSLVLVAFLVPLALLVRRRPRRGRLSAAVVEAQALAPTVATADAAGAPVGGLAGNLHRGAHDLTVYLPSGWVIGAPEPTRRPCASRPPAAASPPTRRAAARWSSPWPASPTAPP